MDGNWELKYITGPKITFQALYPDNKPFLSFNTKEKRVNGNGSCNSFAGNASISQSGLKFDENLVMTRMFCPGTGESIFMDGIKNVTSYSIIDGGTTLNLMVGEVVVMRFQKK